MITNAKWTDKSFLFALQNTPVQSVERGGEIEAIANIHVEFQSTEALINVSKYFYFQFSFDF